MANPLKQIILGRASPEPRFYHSPGCVCMSPASLDPSTACHTPGPQEGWLLSSHWELNKSATSDLFSHLSGFRDGISLSLCVPIGIRNNAVNPFIISIRGQTLPFPKKIIPEFKNWSHLPFRGSSLGGPCRVMCVSSGIVQSICDVS